jgi:hypothetical protein
MSDSDLETPGGACTKRRGQLDEDDRLKPNSFDGASTVGRAMRTARAPGRAAPPGRRRRLFELVDRDERRDLAAASQTFWTATCSPR